ncbi:MAG: ATP-binding protein [Clostridia bacterium]|nr:ATP-binding protein [Clostridia bacterium]
MNYYNDIFRRVADDFASKRKRAEDAADARRFEVETAIPELVEVHLRLESSGIELFGAALSGKDAPGRIAEIKERNDRLKERKRELLVSHGYPADFTDVRYECPECMDTGYASGKMCTCMKSALAMARLEVSGLGHLVKTQTFDTFSTDYYVGEDRMNACTNRDKLKKFADSFDGKVAKNWLLIGSTGLGKTHLSSAVAMTVIDRGFGVVYVTAAEMFSVFERQSFCDMRDRDGSERQFFDADLLIIDDLGTELTNQFTVSCLYNLINSRIISGRSTIINTNLTTAELRKRYDDRITSRLLGEYRPLVFRGKDIRSQKLPK